jgi:hypothetical protein
VDFVQSNLDVLLRHLLPVVFFAFLIEAADLPFPSRIVLLVAATLADEPRQLVGLVAVSTAGALTARCHLGLGTLYGREARRHAGQSRGGATLFRDMRRRLWTDRVDAELRMRAG